VEAGFVVPFFLAPFAEHAGDSVTLFTNTNDGYHLPYVWGWLGWSQVAFQLLFCINTVAAIIAGSLGKPLPWWFPDLRVELSAAAALLATVFVETVIHWCNSSVFSPGMLVYMALAAPAAGLVFSFAEVVAKKLGWKP